MTNILSILAAASSSSGEVAESGSSISRAASIMEGEPYEILLPLGLILLLAKVFSLLLGRLHIPAVVGYLLSGLVVGLIYFIPNQTVLTGYTMGGINEVAKIGVILILFSAGLETDLKKIKAEGVASVIITTMGVLFPLAFGFLAAFLTIQIAGGTHNVYNELYYGVILTATSVSVTVATLKELGRLNSKVGTALTSAAILDDIIGVVLLSVIIALSGSGAGTTQYVANPAWNIVILVLVMIAFFALSILAGFFIHKLFDWMGKKWVHHRRIPIFSLAFCFLWSYLAEKVFHIADITGAYVAGLILSNTSATSYIDHRTDTTANVIFIPVFFASVAMKMYNSFGASGGSGSVPMTAFLIFGVLWVILGLLGKVIGAGTGALICRFGGKDSLRVGLGMMARAEVVIVTAQKGVEAGLTAPMIMPFTIALIIASSFLTPIFLKLSYHGEPAEQEASALTHPAPLPEGTTFVDRDAARINEAKAKKKEEQAKPSEPSDASSK